MIGIEILEPSPESLRGKGRGFKEQKPPLLASFRQTASRAFFPFLFPPFSPSSPLPPSPFSLPLPSPSRETVLVPCCCTVNPEVEGSSFASRALVPRAGTRARRGAFLCVLRWPVGQAGGWGTSRAGGLAHGPLPQPGRLWGHLGQSIRPPAPASAASRPQGHRLLL